MCDGYSKGSAPLGLIKSRNRLIKPKNLAFRAMRVWGRVRSHIRLEDMLSWKKLAFPVLIFVVFPGAVAYAGFFSFFGDIFSKVSTQEKNINSQNIVLLAAAAGPEFLPKDTYAEVNTVAGSALLADAGPVGGPADVYDSDYDHGQISTYVVRDGDSLSTIANMFNVSINTILWANDLSRGARLQVGQTLVILPVSGVQYTVKKGDTIASIAKKYKGEAEEIRSFNGIEDGASLDIGSLLIIPDGEIASIPTSTRPLTARLRNVGGPSYEGYYHAPLMNYRKTQGLHGWNGVDLVSYDGTGAFVAASAGGVVFFVKQGCTKGYRSCGGGYGNYVVINHANGTQTLYGHLKSAVVRIGEEVAQGQLIGYEGNTGRSTGAHLHFEVHGAKNPF